MGRLTGKKAIILGASSEGNMGQVMARRFMDEGAEVLVSGRKEPVLEALRAIHGVLGVRYLPLEKL